MSEKCHLNGKWFDAWIQAKAHWEKLEHCSCSRVVPLMKLVLASKWAFFKPLILHGSKQGPKIRQSPAHNPSFSKEKSDQAAAS